MLKLCQTCNTLYHDERDIAAIGSRWRICDRGHLWFNCSCGSTLLLPKGKFSGYDPGQTLSQESQPLFERLRTAHKLPHVSSAALELQTKLEQGESSSDDLARLAKHEPVIVGLVVAMANGLKVDGNEKPITSLAHAISFIGHGKLAEIVSMVAVSTITLTTQRYTLAHYWERSLVAAEIAHRLALTYWKSVEPIKAYCAGGLANIGKLVLASLYPRETDQICQAMQSPKTAAN